MNATMRKNAPRFVDESRVLVTKAFAKNAMIFGTAEYKLWREIRQDVPTAEMVTKSIKKNPNKKTATKNMTYEKMAIYIREHDDSEALMKEFKMEIARSKVQANPYRFVLAWFMKKFENYDEDYRAFFEDKAKEAAKENDIFRIVKSDAVFQQDAEDEYDLAQNL